MILWVFESDWMNSRDVITSGALKATSVPASLTTCLPCWMKKLEKTQDGLPSDGISRPHWPDFVNFLPKETSSSQFFGGFSASRPAALKRSLL